MPLPSFYNQMPNAADNHFGHEVYTKRYFLLKQKAFYPIFFLVGCGLAIGGLTAAKNMLGNSNITMTHSHLGSWNSHKLNTLDAAQKTRPDTMPVLATPNEDSKPSM